MAKAESIPFDVAVDAEKAFLKQVREMIREEVRAAIGPAVKQVAEMHQQQARFIERLDGQGRWLAAMAQDFNRFSSWATNRGLREDAIDRKLDKLFDLITPVINPPPKSTPP